MTFDGLFKWQNSYKFDKNLPNVPQTDMNAFRIYLCIFEKDPYSSNDILLQIPDILNTSPPPPMWIGFWQIYIRVVSGWS